MVPLLKSKDFQLEDDREPFDFQIPEKTTGTFTLHDREPFDFQIP